MIAPATRIGTAPPLRERQSVDEPSPEAQRDLFISRYTPEIEAQAHEILGRMRALLPGALELVYDNYNAVAIGFGPTEKAGDAIFSIALFPRWVSLFFLRGVGLPDPEGLLRGSGGQVRHIVLKQAEMLEDPRIRALMEEALLRAPTPLDPDEPHRVVIKSISAKQRPRRPGGS